MFARTKVAKAFRKWVLDVVPDREVQQRAQEEGAATALTPAHDSAFAGMVIAARRKMVSALADFKRQMAVWEIVDEQADKSMPAQQIAEGAGLVGDLGNLVQKRDAQVSLLRGQIAADRMLLEQFN